MIVITGVTGLVGSHIARKLLEEGLTLKAICRNPQQLGLAQDLEDKIDWHQGDLLDIPSLEDAINPHDIVIHCAAVVSFNPKEKELMRQVNVEGTANLVNVCLAKNTKGLIHLSSVAAIGRNKNISQINEKQRWENSSLNSEYALTKHLAETEVWRAQAEGLPVVVLNPSVVLGRGDMEKSSSRLFRYVWKERPFYTKGSINYVDVRDIAEVCYQFLQQETFNNERFILNAGSLEYKIFFEKVAQHLDKKPPKYAVPPLMAQVAWRILAFLAFFTGKAPLITRETARLAQKSFLYENDKIKKHLNFEFRDLANTLAWVAEDIKAEFKNK